MGEQNQDAEAQDAAQVWEARYAGTDRVWSGRPNQAIVDVVSGLPAGRALDLGCGEGADAIWLAQQGWQVTAVDVSPTAIARGAAAAAEQAVPEGRITWQVHDLATWTADGPYELVSASFLHSPISMPRTEILRRAATHVTAGGHLLILSHAASPPWATQHHHEHHFATPAEEVEALGLPEHEWQTRLAETRSRHATGPNGESARLDDVIVLVQRR
ncbi:MAG TPA: methyltransferase domain-containing protein [Micromonosporaceae bacterium]|jgi:2-polyprenyl-3-methyl-5-hydroxy-6-metoxy-1,4-benzoquinol methylase